MRFSILLFFSSMFVVLNAQLFAFELVADYKTDAVIYIGSSSCPVVKSAAQELHDGLKQTIGCDLPIVEVLPEKGYGFILGNSDAAKKLLTDIDFNSFKQDEVLYRTVGDYVVLTGHPTRGTLYAVQILLERHLGVRHWTASESFYPKHKKVSFCGLDYRYAPPFWNRDTNARGVGYFRTKPYDYPRFAARMRLNGRWSNVPGELGGGIPFAGGVGHTLWELVPPHIHFKEHPDWFSMNQLGVREAKTLCLTNKGMRDQMLANAIKILNSVQGARVLNISHLDSADVCHCPECDAARKKFGGESGLLVDLLNDIGERLENVIPGSMIETFAYASTRTPPTSDIKVRDNIIIHYANIVMDLSSAIDAPNNAVVAKEIEGWKSKTNSMFFWYYASSHSSIYEPFPNLRYFDTNMRFLAEKGFDGVRVELDYIIEEIGDLPQLKTWLYCQLMWDPYSDKELLIKEFMEGFYGDAAPYIRQYLNLTEEEFYSAYRPFLRGNMDYDICWMSIEGLMKARNILEKAADAVKGNGELERKVAGIQIGLDIATLRRPEWQPWFKDIEAKNKLSSIDREKLYDQLVDTVNKYDFVEKEYALKDIKQISRSVEAPNKSSEIPEICKDLPEESYIVLPVNQDYPPYTYLEDDPAASEGKTTKMPCKSVNWSIQRKLPYFRDGRNQQIWIKARSSGLEHNDAFTAGFFPGGSKTFTREQTQGNSYKYFKIGEMPVPLNTILWVATFVYPEEANIYIDEIVLIDAEKMQKRK